MFERDADEQLAWRLKSTTFTGVANVMARPLGRGSANKTPFIGVVAKNHGGHPITLRVSVTERFRKTGMAAWADKFSSAPTASSLETLSHALTASPMPALGTRRWLPAAARPASGCPRVIMESIYSVRFASTQSVELLLLSIGVVPTELLHAAHKNILLRPTGTNRSSHRSPRGKTRCDSTSKSTARSRTIILASRIS